MTLALLFWILMLIWAVVYGVGYTRGLCDRMGPVNALIIFLLFLILGWAKFGAPIH